MTYYVCVLKEDKTRPVLPIDAPSWEEALKVASNCPNVTRVLDDTGYQWDWTRMEQ